MIGSIKSDRCLTIWTMADMATSNLSERSQSDLGSSFGLQPLQMDHCCLQSLIVACTHMGGVDLFDPQVAAYRICVRSKKLWWSSWSVTAQVVNAWNSYRKKRNFFAGLFTGIVVSLRKLQLSKTKTRSKTVSQAITCFRKV